MRTKLFLTLLICMVTTCGYAQVNGGEDPTDLSLTLYMVNKQNQTGGNPKSPNLSVSILDHTLFFSDVEEEYTLSIFDSNEVLVFTTVISATTSQLDLPMSLVGEYTIRFDTEDFYYLGDINL